MSKPKTKRVAVIECIRGDGKVATHTFDLADDQKDGWDMSLSTIGDVLCELSVSLEVTTKLVPTDDE